MPLGNLKLRKIRMQLLVRLPAFIALALRCVYGRCGGLASPGAMARGALAHGRGALAPWPWVAGLRGSWPMGSWRPKAMAHESTACGAMASGSMASRPWPRASRASGGHGPRVPTRASLGPPRAQLGPN